MIADPPVRLIGTDRDGELMGIEGKSGSPFSLNLYLSKYEPLNEHGEPEDGGSPRSHINKLS